MCNYMETYKRDLAPFFANTDLPSQAHVNKMPVLVEWAGNIEILVATIVFGRDIRIDREDLCTQENDAFNTSGVLPISWPLKSVHPRRDNDSEGNSGAKVATRMKTG